MNEQLPWPDMPECHGHVDRWGCCRQCDGSHAHEWDQSPSADEVADLNAAGIHVGSIAVRCVICGARKCDVDGCLERRHHGGPHLLTNGRVRAIGS